MSEDSWLSFCLNKLLYKRKLLWWSLLRLWNVCEQKYFNYKSGWRSGWDRIRIGTWKWRIFRHWFYLKYLCWWNFWRKIDKKRGFVLYVRIFFFGFVLYLLQERSTHLRTFREVNLKSYFSFHFFIKIFFGTPRKSAPS